MTIDYFVWLAQAQQADLQRPESATAHYHVLVGQGDEAKKEADELRDEWANTNLQRRLEEPTLGLWQCIQDPSIDLATLPPYTFMLQFTFRLAQPYLSKDDNAFYIIDNPIVRDKVFRLPMVRPTGWKGSLRAALWQLGCRHDGEEHLDERVRRMFGETRGDDMGQAGRLFFYPTFFTHTGLEIINPHDRTRRVGKNPILFESVPIGAKGRFTLLYVPFDRVGKDRQKTAQQVAEDLPLLAEGLQAMFTLYGFGAKTSSGFGLAQESVSDGLLTVRAEGLKPTPEPAQATQPDQAVALPRYLEAPGQLHAELRAADGSLVAEEEYRRRIEGQGKKYAKKERQLYRKAKAWWERKGKALSEADAEPESEQPAPPEASTPTWPSWPFDSFEELISQAGRVAEQLTQGGAA
ncbi:MAG TPA: hypothetical protein ENI39_00640 [Anaerolineae bacterium]|nr:hypothetical protein [Anaerolineae bacterium]